MKFQIEPVNLMPAIVENHAPDGYRAGQYASMYDMRKIIKIRVRVAMSATKDMMDGRSIDEKMAFGYWREAFDWEHQQWKEGREAKEQHERREKERLEKEAIAREARKEKLKTRVNGLLRIFKLG